MPAADPLRGDRPRGLTEAEAVGRIARFGRNELPAPRTRTVLRIVVETLREPMFLLMAGAAVLYLILGDVAEGAFLVTAAGVAMGLVIFQEARSERALNALRELAQPHVRVIRDGVERRRPAGDLAPGDLMLVGEGERLAADALLVQGDMLSVDESALTGESAPVDKRLARPDELTESAAAAPGADLSPHLFAGTLVVRGQAAAQVERTGANSALGRIGASLAGIEPEPTPLQKSAGRIVGLLGALALGFCALVATAYGVLRHDWVGGALAGITTAIALVPEEFPMVLTVFMALGAWRMASHRMLVRRGAAVEALGSVTMLCVDKTGTLTENHMQVGRLWTPAGEVEAGEKRPLAAASRDLIEWAALASAVRPVDPMDRAVRTLLGDVPQRLPQMAEPERTWPVRPERMALVQVWRGPGEERLGAAKGAPETIIGLCRLPAGPADRIMTTVQKFAVDGLRVLAVASCRVQGAFPDDPQAVAFEFVGLLGFLDPVRADVPAALREARAAGIDVIMITGDHPATALAIARAAGLDAAPGVMTGPEIAALPFPTLCERLRKVRVFARIAPDQKLLIVEALKADGHVVVMTGDGVNDAPALEAAHIGIAMGRKGTDVAREAADLVLLDDSFAAIVGGVRLGRRIFVNLRRALTYVTAIHVPIAGLALLPILFGLPSILFPMHVVVLELAIDPLCALVFEGEPSEAGAMRRPPRRQDEPLFGLPQLALALAQGASLLAGVLGLYVWALARAPEAQARAVAFAALVIGNLVLALSDAMSGEGRLFAPHRRVYWLIAGVASLLLSIVLLVPQAAAMFEIARPDAGLLAIGFGVSLLASGWMVAAIRLSRVFGRTGGSGALGA